MEWSRGEIIGRGTFGIVNLATLIKSTANQTLFAVKSSHISKSSSLRNEKQVLIELGNYHPNIIQFLGDSISKEKNSRIYNIFLEYASKGSLLNHLRKSKDNRFIISDVKKYTRDILKGLSHIHEKGFIHADVKLENILVFCDNDVKLADFGLARKIITDGNYFELKGTPLYMSPELLTDGKVTTAADIWAVGCAVVEMITGKSVWDCSPENDVSGLFYRIGIQGESPKIPTNLCDVGNDFLSKCFFKDSNERWTARMLLDHPFLSEREFVKKGSVSPTCPFEFSSWEYTETSSIDQSECDKACRILFSSRFEDKFVSDLLPEWSDLDGWITIR